MRRISIIVGIIIAVAGGLWWYATRQPELIAQAVIFDAQGSLQLVRLDGTRTILQAAPAAGTQRGNLTPAPDGQRVAYVQTSTTQSTIYMLDFAGGEPTVLYAESRKQPFYLAWSPDSRWLAFLASDVRMELYLVPSDGTAEAVLVRAGQPSYFAWTEDSQRLLLHIGGAAPQGQLFEYAVAEAQLTVLDVAPGAFQTPAWLDQSTSLIVGQNNAMNRIVRLQNDKSIALSEPTRQAILFSLAPDHQQLAYLTTSERGRSPVHVLNLEPNTTAVLPIPLPLAFFWSPDSTKLAVLVPDSTPGFEAASGIYRVANEPLRVQWFIANLHSDTIERYPPWIPSRDFLNLVPYFDQYATSVALWSPDSSQLIYTDQQGVWSLSTKDGQAQLLSQGTQGFWLPQAPR